MLRRMFLAFAYVSSALASAPAPATGQGLMMRCGPVEGQWDWSTGGVVTIEAPGRAFWAPDVSAAPAFDAEWGCDQTLGMIVITWKPGTVDTLGLSEDGDRLAGSNQLGIAVEGQRYRPKAVLAPAGPVPPRLVGTWLLEVQFLSARTGTGNVAH